MADGAREQIGAFEELRPLRYPVLDSFSVTRERHAGYSLQVTAVSGSEAGRLSLVFSGVRELAIAWPQWDEVRLDVVQIRDISDRGWEDLSFRVDEGSGFFAFSCRDFTAVVELAARHDPRRPRSDPGRIGGSSLLSCVRVGICG